MLQPNDKMLLSPNEASKLTGIQAKVIRLWALKGQVDYITMGRGRIMLNRKSLERLVDEMSRIHAEVNPGTAFKEYQELKALGA